jgi:hypothetical protein
MKKDIFGKGEAVLIDRIMEKLPMDQNKAVQSKIKNMDILALSNKEYFYILRKIFHTFMFDMKEFAIDTYDLSVEEYINALTWLTFVHSLIYKLDLSIEKQASHILPDADIDFDSVRSEINLFLQEHNLLDAEMQKCVERVIRYLAFEQQQLRQNNRLSAAEIFRILELKSADLEVLRRIIMKVGKIDISQQEMEFFNLLDKIREIFDDIRDYQEDLTLKNFNTIVYLNRDCQSAEQAREVLEKYIEQESNRCLSLVEYLRQDKRKKFLTICARLKQEKKYYIEQLHLIP